ncbi:MAG: DUF397 domain-containing protein [Pseudonocardiaceae bacterium]
MHDDLRHVQWRKSSRSGAGNTCVEVTGLDGGHRAMRDSKDPAGPALKFTPAEWTAFIARIRDNELE